MVQVPVFGREDAADQFAIFLALQFNKDVANRITRGRAYFWAVLGDPKEWAASPTNTVLAVAALL